MSGTFFYITESIGGTEWFRGEPHRQFHVKVGISDDVEKRFKEYNVIFPGISCVRQFWIQKSFAKNLEKMFKYYLALYRYYGTECYKISPKEAIHFLSKCFLSRGKVLLNYYTFNKKYLFYLDSIYFGKKIPLFFINKNRKFKNQSLQYNFEIELIKNWSSKETKKFTEAENVRIYHEIIEHSFNFSNNILYLFLKSRLNILQNAVNTWNKKESNISSGWDMCDFFSDQLFWVMRDYYKLFSNKKGKIKKFIVDFKFFDKKLDSGKKICPQEDQGMIIRTIKSKYFYSLSWMLDERGSPSKYKKDPFMLRESLTYWTSFKSSLKNLKSLIGRK